MASRDKSQNVGFVYTNIYHLYKKAQNAAPAAASNAATKITSDQNVWRAEDLGELKITKFQPPMLARPMATPADLNRAVAGVSIAPSASEKAHAVTNNPFDDLKNNLAKLQDLHSKLRFMLGELEDLVSNKNK